MKKELISDSLEGIGDKYIAEAAGYAAAKPFGARTVRWIAAAACLVLVVTAGIAGFSIAAEAREYAAAVVVLED